MGGGAVTTALRDHLAAELAKKVSQRGIVVWQDTTTSTETSPPSCARLMRASRPMTAAGTRCAATWSRCWLAIARQSSWSTHPERLPADDPLEEVRAAGVRFAIRLSTLVRNALKGDLSEQRLAEIGGQARTLAEAEAAVGGDAGGDVRLIGILGASDTRTMALRILTGERAEVLDDQGAWPAAAELLARQIGGSLTGEWDDLRRAALAADGADRDRRRDRRPARCAGTAWGAVNAEQRRRTAELLQAWQTYARMA